MKQLIGPFSQLLTMRSLPEAGPLRDSQLEVVDNGAILCEDGIILSVGDFATLRREADSLVEIPLPSIALPGLIDAHTHICCAGSRAHEYALRLSGYSYQEIAEQGGGILDTVRRTRAATKEELVDLLQVRCAFLLHCGVTTCEIKSGYGLSLEAETKMLEAIAEANHRVSNDLIPTCLAAHARPWEFSDNQSYLEYLVGEVLPSVWDSQLSRRVDIFIEKEAFSPEEATWYLRKAKEIGFAITVHADQFTHGGAAVAAKLGAVSADHLEQSESLDGTLLAEAGVTAIVLPGATLGLGMPFPPARQLLDAGVCLAIASDWNPGSAPMGDLLVQAALLGAAERLSMAETLAAITVRAARGLDLRDRGTLEAGKRADIAAFSCPRYQEILYCQGRLKPSSVFTQGQLVVG